jgi:hypothetical protein
MPAWITEGLKPGDAGYALPSVAGLLKSMREGKSARDPIVEGMERRGWRDLNEPD